MENQKNIIEFKGTIIKCVYNSEDYKVYALEINKTEYPNIELNQYGNVVITGQIHQLGVGIEYIIKAIKDSKRQGSYEVVNISRKKPQNEYDMQVFLSEILTPNQASSLYEAYPDIVDRVINNQLDDIDLNKTKGIKEYTFNVIKRKIVENFVFMNLITEFKGLISLSVIKKLYQTYPSIETIKIKLKHEPYKCLCGISGIGFKTADSILLDIDETSKKLKEQKQKPIIDFEIDLKSSRQRCLACILYLLQENEKSGHTKMDLVDLRNQCIKQVPFCSHHFIDAVKYKDIYLNVQNREVSLKSTYDTEKYIAESIIHGLNNNNNWSVDSNKYKSINGCCLTEEQHKLLENICSHNIVILNGYAGTGKSFCTQSVINLAKDNQKSFKLFAPTGKAAKVLSEYTKESASTIHRGLGYMPVNHWGYNQENKLDCDILIIDEFSMTDIFVFKHVIDALDFNKTKLLLIGDSAQIPSVSCGNLLHDFITSDVIPIVTLTKVFRYAQGGLSRVATDIRNCQSYIDKAFNQKIHFFGSSKDYAIVQSDTTFIIKDIVSLYKKLLSQGYLPEDIQILTAYNKGDFGSVAFNQIIQKIANKNYQNSVGFKCGDITYYKDDIVIQTVNNYKAKIYIEDSFEFKLEEDDNDLTAFIANGETGHIVQVNYNYTVIDFDGTQVVYRKDDMMNISLGYSISIHKSQGSGIKIVILVTPHNHIYMLNSNLLYVGITRTKEKCFHIANPSTVNMAIKKKENLKRNTFMQEFLKNSK